MHAKKISAIISLIISITSWIIFLSGLVYVFVDAAKSTKGTIHGFNGPMLYGMEAFFDTIFSYIAFLFPIVILWLFILVIALASTILTIVLLKK